MPFHSTQRWCRQLAFRTILPRVSSIFQVFFSSLGKQQMCGLDGKTQLCVQSGRLPSLSRKVQRSSSRRVTSSTPRSSLRCGLHVVFFSIVFGKTVSWTPASQVLVGACSSSFLCCTPLALSLMTKCLSGVLTRRHPWITLGPGTRLPEVTAQGCWTNRGGKSATEWSSQFFFLPVFVR